MRKNILFLHAGAEMYGADKVLLDLITRLDRNEYHPVVVLPTEGVLVDALKKQDIEVDVIPYPIMRRKYFTVTGIFSYAYNLLKYSGMLTKYAKEKNIELVHTNTAATLEGCFVSRKLHIPQVWSIHEIIVSPKFMHRFTSKVIAKYATCTVTDSCAVKTHLESSGCFRNKEIKVIYNGVDSKRFCPKNDCEYLHKEWIIPDNAKVFGMMGRVNSWKGQKDFLKAANIVLSKYTDVFAVLIGAAFEGEEWREREMAEEINKSPYKDRIINKGYRTDSECIYKLFDIFVLPSTNPDPLPTVVLENMAAGNPIVAYRHGGVCEMVKEGYNGIFAEVRNPVSLAEQIESLLADDELRKRMGENSRKRLLEKFSMEAYVDGFSHVYEKMLNKAR